MDKIKKRQKDLAMSYDNCAMAGKLKKKIQMRQKAKELSEQNFENVKFMNEKTIEKFNKKLQQNKLAITYLTHK